MWRDSGPTRIFNRITKSRRGCWLYTGGISASGYGIVSVNNKSVAVHRLSYELRVAPIPRGLCVLHRCDVKHCINPKHLFLGTRGDNNADRKQKGRNADRRGEKNTQAKLTPDGVERIRRSYATGKFSQRELGDIHGISQQQVSAIVTGLQWSGQRGRSRKARSRSAA